MKTLAGPVVLLLAASVVVGSGCYSYVPATLETLPAGENVRLTMTRQGRADLPEQFDTEGPFISGKVVRSEAERLVLNVPVARREEGFYVAQIGQEVGVKSSDITLIELRKFNRAKTGLFVVGTAAGAAAVVYTIIEASSRSNNGGPPGQEEFRIPLFSIPVR